LRESQVTDHYESPARPHTPAVYPDAAINVRLWMVALLIGFALTTVGSVLPYVLDSDTGSGNYQIFWPPIGILTVLFLITQGQDRGRAAGIALVTNFVLELYVGRYSLLEASTATAMNLAEATLTAMLSRRLLGPQLNFARLNTLLRFAALCVTPALIVTVTAGALIMPVYDDTPFQQAWFGSFFEEFCGIIMVAPALHTIIMPRDQGLFARSMRERLWLFGLLLVVEIALFGFSFTPALFAIFPVLVGISFRLGPRGAAQAILITSLAAFAFCVYGTAPFATFYHADMLGVGALLQILVLAVLYSVLPAAGAVAETLRTQEELRRVHSELVLASRLAGRAEVATNVLHSVGNALNSINVSTSLLEDRVRKSHVSGLTRLATLLEGQDIGTFVASERGKQLPTFISELSKHLTQEQRTTTDELASLRHSVAHINEIVALQQTHAKRIRVAEEVDLTQLVEDTLRMDADGLTRRDVDLVREFTAGPRIVLDKHKVIEILVNLVRNALHACTESDTERKRITVRIAQRPEGPAISVIDNGVGIAPENLTRIFNHGFTTRASGHGFGLHSASLAAKELGGSLSVHSEGPGRGACFTLELPLVPRPSDIMACQETF